MKNQAEPSRAIPPVPPSSSPSPPSSFLGWLGRQVGHVAHAVRRAPGGGAKGGQTLYRQTRVEESRPADRPGVLLRRTTVDEAVRDPTPAPPVPASDE